MCTLSIIPLHGEAESEAAGFRVVCNRDESRRRPPALPPVRRGTAGLMALLPIDPVSQGTWIAVTQTGCVLSLLNATSDPPARPTPDARSRGEIIPALVSLPNAASMIRAAERIEAGRYPLFRLVIASEHGVTVLASDGKEASIAEEHDAGRPVVLSSSGLGDHLVHPPRLALFEEMVGCRRPDPGRQDAFHGVFWPDRPSLSPMVRREGARTVSRTTIEVLPTGSMMAYEAVDEEGLASSRVRCILPMVTGHAAQTARSSRPL